MSAMTRVLAVVALLALVLAACAEDDATDVAEEAPPAGEEEAPEEEPTDDEPAEEEPADDEPDPAAGATDADVAVASTDLGDVLVDGDGMTLYMFEPDEQGASTCYDDCADSWPPLTIDDDPVAGEGADEDLLGTAERDDGTTQITYDDWPLYHWGGDAEPGDTNGQGIQDVWWVLAPDGTPLRDAPEDDGNEAGAGGGYGSP